MKEKFENAVASVIAYSLFLFLGSIIFWPMFAGIIELLK